MRGESTMRGGETESMKGVKFEARISNLRKLLLKHVTHVLCFPPLFSPLSLSFFCSLPLCFPSYFVIGVTRMQFRES